MGELGEGCEKFEWVLSRDELLTLAALFGVDELLCVESDSRRNTRLWQEAALRSLEKKALLRQNFDGTVSVRDALKRNWDLIANSQTQAVHVCSAPGEEDVCEAFYFCGEGCAAYFASHDGLNYHLSTIKTVEKIRMLAFNQLIDPYGECYLYKNVRWADMEKQPFLKDLKQGSLMFHSLRMRQMRKEKRVHTEGIMLLSTPESTIMLEVGEGDFACQVLSLQDLQDRWDVCIDFLLGV